MLPTVRKPSVMGFMSSMRARPVSFSTAPAARPIMIMTSSSLAMSWKMKMVFRGNRASPKMTTAAIRITGSRLRKITPVSSPASQPPTKPPRGTPIKPHSIPTAR